MAAAMLNVLAAGLAVVAGEADQVRRRRPRRGIAAGRDGGRRRADAPRRAERVPGVGRVLAGARGDSGSAC